MVPLRIAALASVSGAKQMLRREFTVVYAGLDPSPVIRPVITQRQAKRGEDVPEKFEIVENGRGEFRVRFRYSSDVIVAFGAYESKSGAERAVESIKRHMPASDVARMA